MNSGHLSAPWAKVAGMFHVELADSLQRRAWDEVEEMTTPEFVEAVRRENWSEVGDEYGDIESAHAIRDAMDSTSEDSVLDASLSDDRTSRLAKIGHAQHAARVQSLYDNQGGRVGM